VPHGDSDAAQRVAEATLATGLSVSAYGSYDRCGTSFEPILLSAKALGAPSIRVWAGENGSKDFSKPERRQVVEALRERCDLAAEERTRIGVEYHGNTLTDTVESALDLVGEVDHPNLRLYWQPRAKGTFESDLIELERVLPVLGDIHLFHWGPEGFKNRLPLEKGRSDWTVYLKKVVEHSPSDFDRYVHFEFVPDDSPDSLRKDATVLHEILQNL